MMSPLRVPQKQSFRFFFFVTVDFASWTARNLTVYGNSGSVGKRMAGIRTVKKNCKQVYAKQQLGKQGNNKIHSANVAVK